MNDQIGGYAFLAGAVIAILLGLIMGFVPSMVLSYEALLVFILVLLGLIVGFVNVRDKEINDFLLAAVALLLVGSANLAVVDGFIAPLGTALGKVVYYISVFVAPAALIVALKAIYDLGKK